MCFLSFNSTYVNNYYLDRNILSLAAGSECISDCKSMDIIPVYIVTSGVLPVLLATLKEPYDKAKSSTRRENIVQVSIAVGSILVNLAWLIAGTSNF